MAGGEAPVLRKYTRRLTARSTLVRFFNELGVLFGRQMALNLNAVYRGGSACNAATGCPVAPPQ